MLTKRSPKSPGCGMGMRNNMTPQVARSADIFANSPKSLSKVSKTRANVLPDGVPPGRWRPVSLS